MKRFSATVKSSTQPESWRSSGIDRDAGPRHRAGVTGAARGDRRPRPCRSRARSRLDSTSPSARWPLPSTPATPTISPACTSSRERSSSTRPSRPSTDGVDDAEHRGAAVTRSAAPAGRSSMTPNAAPRRAANLAADHRPGQRAGVGVGGRAGLDDPAVAHDRDLVGRRDDLGQLVADERDRLALVLDHDGAARRTGTAASAGDSTDVGSSKTRISGSRRRHLMISTRWRMPAVQVGDRGRRDRSRGRTAR